MSPPNGSAPIYVHSFFSAVGSRGKFEFKKEYFKMQISRVISD